MDLEQEKANSHSSLFDLATKYGYTEYHIRRLARSGRIQAVRYGAKGEWRIDEKSLEKYHQETTQRRFGELKKEHTASAVLYEGSLNADPEVENRAGFARKELDSHYGTRTQRDVIQTPNQSAGADATGQASHRGPNPVREKMLSSAGSFAGYAFHAGRTSNRVNAIPKKFLLLVGGILFLINFIPAVETIDLNLNKTPFAKQYSQVKETVSADILEPFRQAQGKLRNFISNYFLPEYGIETYLVIDPYERLGSRIKDLELRIRNYELGINDQAPTPTGQAKKTTIIREVTVSPSGTILTQLEQRIDNVSSLIEATRINLSTLAGDFTNFQRITPTTYQLPSTNTSGIGPLTLSPDKLNASSLTITGSTVINNSLGVLSDFSVNSNVFKVDATKDRVGIRTDTPTTTLEVQGTASASYLLTGNTLQVGGYSSVAYSRFGADATSHAGFISSPNDVLISGDLEINGGLFIDGSFTLSEASASFYYAKGNNAASPSFSFTTDKDSGFFRPGANVIAFSTGGTERLRIDNLGKVGVGAAPSTVFEVQGTASASYLLTGNTLQVGGYSSVAYNRFGTLTTGHSNYISSANDLLISGDLETRGTASFGGVASISGNLYVFGDIGIGTSNVNAELTVIGSGSFTGQLKATRNPTKAHTGTWPSFTNTNNATFYLNPSSPVADGNVIAYVNGSSPKFVVDAEGDIFGNNLILTGTTTQGTTDITGDLTVEGNARLGDAVTDKVKIVGTVLPYTLSSFPLLVKASASQTVDVFRVLSPNDNKLFTIDQQYGLLIASSGFNFALGNSTATVSYSRLGTSTTGHSLLNKRDLLVSGLLETDGNVFFDSKASISSNLQISGRFIADTAASHSFAGDLTVSKEFVSSGTASNSFAGSLNITKGLRVTGNITNDTFTASRLVFSNGSKVLSSVSNLTSWIAGTTNQITVTDDSDGSVTLSLPQNIHTSATPRFAKLGLGTVPVTVLEVQGTASASYLLAGKTLQVGGYSSKSYSRFGTGTTSEAHYITGSSDLFITQDLEVDGSVSFAGPASISNTLYVSTLGKTGNVGIGTTSPLGRLDIVDTSEPQLRVRNSGVAGANVNFQNSDTGTTSTDGLYVGIGSDEKGYVWHYENAALGFATNNLERMTISAGGKVGIGTTGPATKFEVQGTASASYLLTGNTLQVGGFASKAYSRFGTSTTGHANYISTSNDLLISGDLEVKGTGSFNIASASVFWLPDKDGGLLSDCDAETNTLNWDRATGKFDCLADGGGGSVSSNSLDFDEFVKNMTVDQDTTITASSSLTINLTTTDDFILQDNGTTRFIFTDLGRIGINTSTPQTLFEVQGTASASYLLTGNTLQVGGYSSVAYSRFGISTTGYSNFISTTNDLLISGDLEVNATAQFDGNLRIGNASTSAQFIMKSGDDPVKLGGINAVDGVLAVSVDGKYAYTGTPGGGATTEFHVVDVTNPSSPAVIGNLELGNQIKKVFISGRYAYLGTKASPAKGFLIVDISNPAKPYQVGSLAFGGFEINDVYVSGKYAYLAGQNGKFYIVDVSDPSDPRIVSTTTHAGGISIFGVHVAGKYAYLAGDDANPALGANDFSIYNISNPANPRFVGGSAVGGRSNTVYVSGRYAFVGTAAISGCSGTTFGCELRIWDISNPASPSGVAGLEYGRAVNSVHVNGDYAYIGLATGAGNDFRIIDVSNPSSPVNVGGADLTVAVNQVYVSGKYAYVAHNEVSTGDNFDLSIFNIAGVRIPTATIGNIMANNLNVSEYLSAAGVSINSGLNIGQGGVFSAGPISIGKYNSLGSMNDPLLNATYASGSYIGDVLSFNIGAKVGDSFSGNFLRFQKASSSYIIFEANGSILASGAAQFGAAGVPASKAYSRFGTSTATAAHVTTTNDVLISGDLEVIASIALGNFNTTSATHVCRNATSKYLGGCSAHVSEWYPVNIASGSALNSDKLLDQKYEGSLVSISDIKNTETDVTAPSLAVESQTAYDPRLLGIISSIKSGANGNRPSYNYLPLTLVGRVPVKVSLENGPIKPGDRLTSSSTPGVAMKAIKPGMTIGIALEPIDTVTSGSDANIMTFVNVSYWAPADSLTASSEVVDSGAIFDLDILFNSIVKKFYEAMNIVFEQGLVKVAKGIFSKVETDELCVGSVCVTESEFIKIFGSGATPSSEINPEPSPSASYGAGLISNYSNSPTEIPGSAQEPSPSNQAPSSNDQNIEATLTPEPFASPEATQSTATPEPSPSESPTPEPTPEPEPEQALEDTVLIPEVE